MLKRIQTRNSLRLAVCGCGRGSALVENLVSIVILGVTLAGASRLFISNFHGNASGRTSLSVVSEIFSEVDIFRNANFTTLAANLWDPLEDPPEDGDQIELNHAELMNLVSALWGGELSAEVADEELNKDRRSSFSATFTAHVRPGASRPHAITVDIDSRTREGRFGESTTRYSTVIAHVL